MSTTLEVRSNRVKYEMDENKLTGYAVVFDSESKIIPGDVRQGEPRAFIEKIERGAISDKDIKANDPRAFWNHDHKSLPLGRFSSGTLRFSQDERGLKFEVDLPEWASDLKESVARGDVDSMSFGFSVVSEKWDVKQSPPLRSIKKLNLQEISVVNYPAYLETEVAVRSLEEAEAEADAEEKNRIKEKLEIERLKIELS